jgi:uncharacterized GH25 family protein
MLVLRCAIAAVLVVLPVSSFAHDLWIVPGEGGVVELAQGMEFPLSDGAPKKKSFESLEVVAPDGSRRALLKFEAERGLYLAAAVTTAKSIELSAAEFNEYLISDGLAHVWMERAKEKALERPAKEKYQKWVKALVRIGDGPGDATRRLGHVLEIVPSIDPTTLAAPRLLEVTVLFRAKPLAGAYLGWDREGDGPEPAGMVRTDANGRALVPIAGAGRMAIRMTHMTHPREKDHEWASYWTTLTFMVPSGEKAEH